MTLLFAAHHSRSPTLTTAARRPLLTTPLPCWQVSAISHSPLEAFISEMHAEICRCPEVRFFLATDCAQTERMLHERYRPL